MKRARDLNEFAELVRQARYEVDELRACWNTTTRERHTNPFLTRSTRC